MKIGSTIITVVKGSVLNQNVDAVVNAANPQLGDGAGINGLIFDKAGPQFRAKMQQLGGTAVGTAVITKGYNLRQPYIIHTPGPIWQDGKHRKPEQLVSSYRSCLERAEEKHLSSIAFCSISTGIYGYPIASAAALAITTVVNYIKDHPNTSIKQIIFAMFADAEYPPFSDALASLNLGDVSPKINKTDPAFNNALIIKQASVSIVHGSVLEQDVDAIVNAADEHLTGKGGIDKVIQDKAGDGIKQEIRTSAPNGMWTGAAFITSGHNLKQKYVIHAVGPDCRKKKVGDDMLLISAYRSCLEVADAHSLTSVAFCSLSTGAFGFDLKRAASLAVKTVINYLYAGTSLKQIIFAMDSDNEYQAFTQALADASATLQEDQTYE